MAERREREILGEEGVENEEGGVENVENVEGRGRGGDGRSASVEQEETRPLFSGGCLWGFVRSE